MHIKSVYTIYLKSACYMIKNLYNLKHENQYLYGSKNSYENFKSFFILFFPFTIFEISYLYLQLYHSKLLSI